jgi:poly(3-hydroxybutyrate) depolymerase
MKNLLFASIMLFFASCGTERYQTIEADTDLFSIEEMNSDAPFGSIDEILHDTPYHQSQDAETDDNPRRKFNLFRPNGAEGKIPLVLVLHEGAFLDGSRNDFVADKIAKDLCRFGGFSSATLDYTLIRNPMALIDKSFTHKKINEAVADIRIAIQHFKDNANKYAIDEKRIYVVGWSAGGIIANSLVFTDLNEALDYNSQNRHVEFKGSESYKQPLGLAGVVSIGGALLANQCDDSDLGSCKLMLWHGGKDDLVPYGKGPVLQRFRGKQGIDLPSPTVGIEDENGHTQTLKFKLNISAWLTNAVGNLVTTDVYGSKAIYDLNEGNENVSMVLVHGGSHSFFLTDGSFNKTYLQMREKMIAFINE